MTIPRDLGPPLALDDAALDTLAAVQPADVAAAAALWARFAPPWARDLLAATVDDDDA
jgi:hypothetical protein